jgi:hypothetical protein
MADVNPFAVFVLAWCLFSLGWTAHSAWRWARSSPLEVVNHDMARERARRRRE